MKPVEFDRSVHYHPICATIETKIETLFVSERAEVVFSEFHHSSHDRFNCYSRRNEQEMTCGSARSDTAGENSRELTGFSVAYAVIKLVSSAPNDLLL